MRAVARALPGAETDHASIAGRGFDVWAWRVPSPGGDWLVRVPRHEDAIEAIEGQQRLGVRLEAMGLPVPREHRLLPGDDGRTLASAYRFVEGRTGQVHGHSARRRLATSLGEFLSSLHALDVSVAIECGAAPYEPWRDHWAPMIERCSALVAPRTGAWLTGVGERLAEASRSLPRLVVTHADLKPDHVIVDTEERLVAALDFEGARVTDPAVDFARVRQNWDRRLMAMALEAYEGPIDAGLEARAECYIELDALESIDIALRRDWPDLIPGARRALGARAAAASRRASMAAKRA
ncbi:MAG: aminoglycoside phosphotransferase family protein [Dehalococcoidia bacterium]